VTLHPEDEKRIGYLIELLETIEDLWQEADPVVSGERVVASGITRDVEGAYWAAIAVMTARLWAQDSGRSIGEIGDRLRLALSQR
jgi:hypothetical protein